MPQLDWSVQIVSTPEGGAGFMPNLGPGSKVGDPLQAQVDDIVTWGNDTEDTHQPWPVQADGITPVPYPYTGLPANYLSDPIEKGGSSTPQFVVTGNVGDTIKYCCRFHPDERGQISVVANFA